MNRTQRRANSARLRTEMRLTSTMRRIANPERPTWLSTEFMAALYLEGEHVRLSVNRTGQGLDGRWQAGISWDDLMTVKSQCGFADRWAVEILPPDDQVIDVANMRHLWLLPEPPAFGWHSTEAAS